MGVRYRPGTILEFRVRVCVSLFMCELSLAATFNKIGLGFNIPLYVHACVCYHTPRSKTQIGSCL